MVEMELSMEFLTSPPEDLLTDLKPARALRKSRFRSASPGQPRPGGIVSSAFRLDSRLKSSLSLNHHAPKQLVLR